MLQKQDWVALELFGILLPHSLEGLGYALVWVLEVLRDLYFEVVGDLAVSLFLPGHIQSPRVSWWPIIYAYATLLEDLKAL